MFRWLSRLIKTDSPEPPEKINSPGEVEYDDSNFSRDHVLEIIHRVYSENECRAVLTELDSLGNHLEFKGNPVMLAQLQLSILKIADGRSEFIISREYREAFPDWRDLIIAAGLS